MSLWHRIFGWKKAEPVPFVPVYPEFCSAPASVAVTQRPLPVQHDKAWTTVPAPKRKHNTKPWNKPKALRNISAGVLADMRAAGFYGACTVSEMNEWISEHVHANALNIGGLTYTSIRAEIKKCSGVRCENRRLLIDPAYESLRARHKARKQFLPERCWIFIIDSEPELVEAGVQLNTRRAA